jgi:hypothetical protein
MKLARARLSIPLLFHESCIPRFRDCEIRKCGGWLGNGQSVVWKK